MQLNTMLKFGGMAFDVARDERIQELVKMVHQGAKRRGLYGQIHGHASVPKPAIPFAPKTQQPIPSQAGLPSWLNAENAKKMLSVASDVGQLLLK
ncbi:hypothetical protein ACOJUR_05705 [Alicyclobacillus tolerans]|uniref:Uncharacterized protein n=2 Tax=Alicyclobacillus tolerans TaxID=90970 RepID=A0A1M6L141_9BACL|nr:MULTISPECIES: hypothetical protein [Alicyclobacillus]MDP9727600.1 hypothetical protein [Alicyclobacillus tengchongensis]SHJ64985.1 hypothetical protein SAMN05443507_10272 [Alicyclobacillus montanus]